MLGRFALRVGDNDVAGLPRKAQALVAFLAMQPGRHVPREMLADLLWTQSGSQQARQSLRQMLVVLRRTPAGDCVTANAEAMWIEPGCLAVDALALEAGAISDDPVLLAHGVSLYRGVLLEDLPAVSPGFDEWLLPQRERLAGLGGQALRRLAAMQMAAGDADAAVSTAAQLVRLDALDEAAHRLLIECLARAGRRAAALQQFEACVRILQAELDIAPDPETLALADRVRGGVPQSPARNGHPLPAEAAPATDAATASPAGPAGARFETTSHTAVARPMAMRDRPSAATDDAEAARPAEVARTAHASHTALAGQDTAAGAAERVGATAMPARAGHRMRSQVGRIALVVCVAAIALGVLTTRPSPRPPGLAITTLRNVAGIPARDIVVAGFDDLLQARLAMRHRLRLIDGPHAVAGTAPAGSDGDGQDSAIRYRLEGSAAFLTETVQVSVRLTDARNDTELWSTQYDRPVADVVAIADDIAAHIARAVADDPDIVAAAQAPADADRRRVARELVALGQQIDYYSAATIVASRDIYRLAYLLDNDNADVMVHLANADLRAAMADWPLDQAVLAGAGTMLLHATRRDPTNIPALFNLCLLRRLQGNVPDAIMLCQRVLDLNPRYPGALRELANATLESGDAARAIASYQAAIDAAPTLPYNYLALKGLGVASLVLGRRDDAITYLRKAVEADLWKVDDEQLWLAAVLEMTGQHAAARQTLGEFKSKHVGLQVDGDYLMLLNAPDYADRKKDVLAALAGAGSAK